MYTIYDTFWNIINNPISGPLTYTFLMPFLMVDKQFVKNLSLPVASKAERNNPCMGSEKPCKGLRVDYREVYKQFHFYRDFFKTWHILYCWYYLFSLGSPLNSFPPTRSVYYIITL